jgi:hypothetical protein
MTARRAGVVSASPMWIMAWLPFWLLSYGGSILGFVQLHQWAILGAMVAMLFLAR